MEEHHPQQIATAVRADSEVHAGSASSVNRIPVETIIRIRNIFINITKPNYKSKKPHLMQEMALANALIGKTTLVSIADAFEKHHATIIHYRENHDGNMKSWNGYKELFAGASTIVESYMDELELEEQIERIGKTIKFLNRQVEIKEQQLERVKRLSKLPIQHQNP